MKRTGSGESDAMSDGLLNRLETAQDERDYYKARLAEAVECCTIKDNRNLRLEAKVADLERQLHWALTGDMPTDSASGGDK